jgi:hypothetical protein
MTRVRVQVYKGEVRELVLSSNNLALAVCLAQKNCLPGFYCVRSLAGASSMLRSMTHGAHPYSYCHL